MISNRTIRLLSRWAWWPFFIVILYFVTACSTQAPVGMLSEPAALAPSLSGPTITMPNIVIPTGVSWFPWFATLPLPPGFAHEVEKMAEGEETTLTRDYDVATTADPGGDPNDPCANKPGFPENARSKVHWDQADDTITRTVYTADGQRIGYIQSSLMEMNGEQVLVKWMQVEEGFAGRGIATMLLESSQTDFARFYPDRATTTKMVMADKNGRSYSCYWSRNPQMGTVNDNGEQLPYTQYDPSRPYYQMPPEPGSGEFQIPDAGIWQVPVAPQPVDGTGPYT